MARGRSSRMPLGGRAISGPALANGFGIIGRVEANAQTGITVAADLAEAVSYPFVDVVQLQYRWKLIEPAEGVFDFSQIDADLATVHAGGKKALLTFAAIGPGLPTWYFDDPAVIHLTTSDELHLPLYWDPRHIARILAVYDALAARYGADPRIEGFKPFGYSNTSDEPNFYEVSSVDATLRAQMIAGLDVNEHPFTAQAYNGSRPTHTAASPYTTLVALLLRAWAARFPHHALFVTQHFTYQSHEDEAALDLMLYGLAQELRAVACNTGLNESDKLEARAYFAAAKAGGCWKCGWSDVTNITGTDAAWYEAMRQALGGRFDAGTYPGHGVCSYLTFRLSTALPDRAAQAIFARALLDRT